MNKLVLIFTRDQLLNILTRLEVQQAEAGIPQIFRITVPAVPDGVSVEWGQVTLEIKPDEVEEVQPTK